MKCKYCPYGQCHIETFHDNENKWTNYKLYSYETHVATAWKDDNSYVYRIDIYGLYSMTTRKHIRAFLKEIQDMASNSNYIPFDDIKQVAYSAGKIRMSIDPFFVSIYNV